MTPLSPADHGGDDPPWLPPALERFETFVRGAGPMLRPRLERAVHRIGRSNGAASVHGALTSRAATPFLRYLEALRRDAGLAASDPRLVAIGEAALLAYAHVRVQDDLVDEPDLIDRASVYAMEAFACASARALAEAAGERAGVLFALRERAMQAFAEAALFEVDALRAGAPAPEGTAWLGDKLLPMAVPLGAVAIAGAWGEARVEGLVAFVRAAGEGIQILNDVLNAGDDLAAGRATPVIAWLGETSNVDRCAPPRVAYAALAASSALDRAAEAARAALARAAGAARAVDAPELAAAAFERAALIDGLRLRVLALSLGRIER